jgi:hypothetical protein
LSVKKIPPPRAFPDYKPGQSPAQWAQEVKVWQEQHLREIHQELEQLHALKADVTP